MVLEHLQASGADASPQANALPRIPAAGPPDALVAKFVEQLVECYGDRLDAIILYGSYLRGAVDAMPDLYVLLDAYPPRPRLHRWLGALLPPNVHNLAVDDRRAKVSVLRTKQLLRAVMLDLNPYFWARFAQPNRILLCRNEEVRQRLRAIFALSARRLMSEVAPDPPPEAPADFWLAVFTRTYAAEMRSEGAGKREALYTANHGHYDQLLQRFRNAAKTGGRERRPPWPVVRAMGKTLSALRILKSALTFAEPVDYMLWKLERHSGIRLEASERQRRHPLLFAWPLVWRLYRLGAFR